MGDGYLAQAIHGKRSGKVDSFAKTRRHDLYLLTTPDVPFVDDGLRDGERIRDDMFHWFRDALDAEQLPYRILSGSYDSRFEAAKKAVESILMNSKGIFVGIPEHTKVCS
jgi:HTH-type transcriptional repressor of NAD biosynthesis genes